MRNTTQIVIGASVAIGVMLASFDSVHAQIAGRYAAPILRISPYARQVAMGEAFTALANDINVMRYNIGGLGHLRYTLLSTHFHQWIEDTYQGALEAAIPTRYGVLGFNLAYFDEGEITELDKDFVPTGNVLESSDLVLSLGYGRYFTLFKNTLSYGAAIKLVRQNLVEEAGSALGLDVGLLYSLKHISVGATLQNLTISKLQIGSNGASFLLPETIRGGVATRLPIGKNFKWNVGVDAARFLDDSDKDIRIYAGTELRISEVFALRGGYKFHDTEISRWGAGFGVIIPMEWLGGASTAFDYAYSPLEQFDSQAHRFSVSFNFGALLPAPRGQIVDRSAIANELDAARRARQEAEEARMAATEAEERVKDLEKLLAERLRRVQEIAETSRGAIEVEEKANRNVLMTLRINFDFDKADIRPDMYETMYKVAEILNTYPESQVWIAGHTDSIGTAEYNFHLSKRRMMSVTQFLEREGISPDRFYNPVPYGEWMPLASNRTPADRFRNRRVEFLIYTGDNKPELPRGSMIEGVQVAGDTISVTGNGQLTFTKDILDDPPRVLLRFPKVYIPDPMTIPVGRGNIRQARLGFHPEDGSTWVVLDVDEPVFPGLVAVGNRLNILSERRLVTKP